MQVYFVSTHPFIQVVKLDYVCFILEILFENISFFLYRIPLLFYDLIAIAFSLIA